MGAKKQKRQEKMAGATGVGKAKPVPQHDEERKEDDSATGPDKGPGHQAPALPPAEAGDDTPSEEAEEAPQAREPIHAGDEAPRPKPGGQRDRESRRANLLHEVVAAMAMGVDLRCPDGAGPGLLREAVVEMGLWQKANEALDSRAHRRTRGGVNVGHGLNGTMTCWVCGSALVHSVHKGIAYMACSHPQSGHYREHARVDRVNGAILHALRRLQIGEDAVAWVTGFLREEHASRKAASQSRVEALRQACEKMQKNLDQAYDHLLEGLLPREDYRRRTEGWRVEMVRLRQEIAALDDERFEYMDDGADLLAFAQTAASIYPTLTLTKQRQFLKVIFASLQWKEGNLTPGYRAPFDLLATLKGDDGQLPPLRQSDGSIIPLWQG